MCRINKCSKSGTDLRPGLSGLQPRSRSVTQTNRPIPSQKIGHIVRFTSTPQSFLQPPSVCPCPSSRRSPACRLGVSPLPPLALSPLAVSASRPLPARRLPQARLRSWALVVSPSPVAVSSCGLVGARHLAVKVGLHGIGTSGDEQGGPTVLGGPGGGAIWRPLPRSRERSSSPALPSLHFFTFFP